MQRDRELCVLRWFLWQSLVQLRLRVRRSTVRVISMSRKTSPLADVAVGGRSAVVTSACFSSPKEHKTAVDDTRSRFINATWRAPCGVSVHLSSCFHPVTDWHTFRYRSSRHHACGLVQKRRRCGSWNFDFVAVAADRCKQPTLQDYAYRVSTCQ